MQSGLSLPWSQTRKTGFLVTRLINVSEVQTIYMYDKQAHSLHVRCFEIYPLDLEFS